MKNIIIAFFLTTMIPLWGQTIAEKKAGSFSGSQDLSPQMQRFLVEVNRDIRHNQDEIQRLFAKAQDLFFEKAPDELYRDVLIQINDLKGNIQMLQESWREMAARSGIQADGYALWHQPETTIEQLIMDFGSSEFVYMIPPEIAEIKLSISSNIPIPTASWGQMLELILIQSGVGIRQLNPYLRQLYLTQSDLSDIKLVTANRDDLAILPSNTRICFVLSPEPSDVGRVFFFLDKFVNQNSMVIQNLGRSIMVVGQIGEVQELLKIYDFILANKRDLQYSIVPLYRVDADEMSNILGSIFEQFQEEREAEAAIDSNRTSTTRTENRSTSSPSTSKSKSKTPTPPPRSKQQSRKSQPAALTVIPLTKIAPAVFLVGTAEEIEKAVDIIKTVEAQVGEATQRVIYQYTVAHSDPEELAQVLAKIYAMMQVEGIVNPRDVSEEDLQKAQNVQAPVSQQVNVEQRPAAFRPRTDVFREGFYQQGQFSIDPALDAPGVNVQKREVNVGRDNFIVDLKSNSIVMVVEAYILPQIKELIKKLDVPKMMVQIDVLLFERSLKKNNNYGLNLLRIGSCASQTRVSCFKWNDLILDAIGNIIGQNNQGITSLLMSRRKGELGHLPAFDIIYKFLMSQDDITLNASPSVVTVNQTEALIEIKQEISISTGTFEIPQTGTGAALKDSFVRAQYGITIRVTPTVHMHNTEDPLADPVDYVTLVTDVTFDTFGATTIADINRPPVNTRHVVNEVRVPDGMSIIMGGLRQRKTDDKSEKIPFLGEIPGFGKLFSTTALETEDLETIIFLKPKIITDPVDEFMQIRRAALCKRPGDIPEFLCCLNQALEYEKYRTFDGTMTMLFGKRPDRCIPTDNEYGL